MCPECLKELADAAAKALPLGGPDVEKATASVTLTIRPDGSTGHRFFAGVWHDTYEALTQCGGESLDEAMTELAKKRRAMALSRQKELERHRAALVHAGYTVTPPTNDPAAIYTEHSAAVAEQPGSVHGLHEIDMGGEA